MGLTLAGRLYKTLAVRESKGGGAGGGSGYGISGSCAWKQLEPVLADLLKDVGSKGVVLDAGCAGGRLLWAMAMMCPDGTVFHGFDLDERVDPGAALSISMSPKWDKELRDAILKAKSHMHFHVANATCGDKGPKDTPRVESIEGATHVIAVWEAWTTDDQEDFFEMWATTKSARVICMVQKRPTKDRFDPVAAAAGWEDVLTVTGPLPAPMEVGQTQLYAWTVRKREGWIHQLRSLMEWTPRQPPLVRVERDRQPPIRFMF
jgi:hypothetical protein